MSIHFYRTRDAYGAFSNFYASPINLNGKTWPTVEHYFQAQKFAGTDREEQIRKAATAMASARMGRSRKHPIREDWEEAKDNIMRLALLAKFEQHEDLREILIGTGTEDLIEKTTRDHYWGCGTNGTGKNMLGILLMEVRNSLTHGK